MTTKSENINLNIIKVFSLILLIFSSLFIKGENLVKLLDLEGNWKFTVGDDPSWANVDCDDKDWDWVIVPKAWEQEGFVDYDGFAWYRKEFFLQEQIEEEVPFLVLGYIDDVDEVYLNGQLIGATGVMPPKVWTAFRVLRKYPLPKDLLNPNGKNVIAIRVFDEYSQGGIYAGPVGIFHDKNNELLSLNLAGYWDFKPTFDEENTADQFYNQKNDKIYVPGYWESFGYAKLDGRATYLTHFILPKGFDDDNLMLVLGYIDDIDKVYLNEERIGTVDNLRVSNNEDIPNNHILRGYPIPSGVLIKGGINTLKVKVYDTGGMGGIYEGPVGLITTSNFKRLNRTTFESNNNYWEQFFKDLFQWD